MLYEIYCDKFYQKQIKFNNSLSVILGTNNGDNSIGKIYFFVNCRFCFWWKHICNQRRYHN